MHQKKYWKIEGYDGTEQLFQKTLPFSAISEKAVITLLQRLACKYLSDSEIIDASLRKSHQGYAGHLEHQKSRGPRFTVSVGSNPHFLASIWLQHELPKS